MTKLWVFLLKIYINFLNFFLYFKENFLNPATGYNFKVTINSL